jgi:hypothetical protein
MQPGQPVVLAVAELGSNPRSGLDQEHLDPLIVASEAMLGDQPLIDHRPLQVDGVAQPRLHQRNERGDQQRLRTGPRWWGRWRRRRILSQILTNRAPITAALAADLSERGACSVQDAETTNVHPGLQIQDHEEVTLRVVYLPVDNRRVTPLRASKGSTRRNRPTRQVVRRTTYEVVRGHTLCTA